MPRNARRVVARLVCAVMIAMSLSAQPANAAIPAAADAQSNLDVEVPFYASDTREVPEGWVVTACPDGQAPNLVKVTCDGGRVTFTGEGYTPDAGEQEVRIALTFNGAPQSLTYTVTLAPPGLQGPRNARYPHPLAQGTQATIPFSELLYDCASCAESAPTYAKPSVSPKKAGSAIFSGTGLVFSPAPDFSGEAKLKFVLRDGYGQETKKTSITVTVVPGETHAPSIVADLVQVDTGQAAHGNALSNDIAEDDYTSVVSSCGIPSNGTVQCQEDGSYIYTPNAGFTGIDQFSYQVSTATSGDQAVGSVVVGIGVDPSAVIAEQQSSEMVPLMAPPYRPSSQEIARTAGVLGVFRDSLATIHGGGAG